MLGNNNIATIAITGAIKRMMPFAIFLTNCRFVEASNAICIAIYI